MALSSEAVNIGWQKFTFAAADATPDTTNMQRVLADGGEAVNGNKALGHQALRITAQFTASGATGALVLCLVDLDGDDIIGYWTVTATVTAIRTGEDGSSGNYIATVGIGSGSSDLFDLTGIGRAKGRLALYLGCTALSAGSLIVYTCPTRCI